MRIETDTLFVAMTRPASRWGVSLEWLTLYWGLTLVVFIGGKTILAFLLAPPLHIIGVIGYRYDPYVLRIIGTWVSRCSASAARVTRRRSVYSP